MSQQNFPGQFPLTAPDLAVSPSPGGVAVDADDLMTETTTEAQNLQQDLTNRLIELPGSNLDFGDNNTRGIGIMTYLNAPAGRLLGLPARIDAEFEQDPRVTSSHTTITQGPADAKGQPTWNIDTQAETVAGVVGLGWSWTSSGLYPQPLGS